MLKNGISSERQKFIELGRHYLDGFLRLIALLAYESDKFPICVDLLIEVTPHTGDFYSKNDLQYLIPLFYPNNSGSHATLSQKLESVDHLLKSASLRKHRLAIELLGALLSTRNHYYPFYTFGAHIRDSGYHFKSQDEYIGWFESVFDYILTIIKQMPSITRPILKMIATNFGRLWQVRILRIVLFQKFSSIRTLRFWPEGYLQANEFLYFAQIRAADNSIESTSEDEGVEQLQELIEILKPGTLEEEYSLCLCLSYATLHHLGYATDSLDFMLENARKLGGSVATTFQISPTIIELSCIEGGLLARQLGVGLAKGHKDHSYLWSLFHEQLHITPKEDRKVDVLGGVICGINQSDPAFCRDILQSIYSDSELNSFFPNLLGASGYHDSYSFIMKTINERNVSFSAYWGFMEAIGTLVGIPQQIREIVLTIAKKPGGSHMALEIYFRCFSGQISDRTLTKDIALIGHELLLFYEFDNHDSSDYELAEMMKCYLILDNKNLARQFFSRVFDAMISAQIYLWHFDLLKKAMLEIDSLFFLDTFINDLIDFKIRQFFRDINDFSILDGQDEAIIQWCSGSPELRYTRIAWVINIFSHKDSTYSWTNIALHVLHATSDPRKILGIYYRLIQPKAWTGSRAAIIWIFWVRGTEPAPQTDNRVCSFRC